MSDALAPTGGDSLVLANDSLVLANDSAIWHQRSG